MERAELGRYPLLIDVQTQIIEFIKHIDNLAEYTCSKKPYKYTMQFLETLTLFL